MTFRHPLGRRLRRGLLALGATALVAACGGGTSQVETFVAEQVVVFGDETSALTPDGRKYSVNVLTEDKALDCEREPIWVQAVASYYGLVFAECNPGAVAEPKARMAAAAGARVADLAPQIDAVLASGGFAPRSLATVLVGANDVLDLYAQYPARTELELLDELRARGASVGEQVNRLAGLGLRVLVATVPDQGRTPFALAQQAAHTDTDRAALLGRMGFEFNAGLRVKILNDGRKIGLVLADEMVTAMAENRGSFALANVTSGVCTAVLPDCSTDTLVEGGRSAAWLWADERQLAYGGQQRLGLLARDRLSNNPF